MKNSFLTPLAVRLAFVVSSLALLSCTNGSSAKATEENAGNYASMATLTELKFITAAAEINMEEIELGKLAQINCMHNDIKLLGASIQKGHEASLKELSDIAGTKAVTLPTHLTRPAMDAYKGLKDKMLRDFDSAYCDKMVKGHEDAIMLFERATVECQDVDLRNWATAMLPQLRMHLDAAMTCQKKFEL